MSRFADAVKQDTPRLVVEYRSADGQETYNWGVVGKVPILPLIGAVVRVQMELHAATGTWRTPEVDDDNMCPERALVVAYDTKDGAFRWFVGEDIPTDSLVGMMETIKHVLTASQLQRVTAPRGAIVGPDGQPFRG